METIAVFKTLPDEGNLEFRIEAEDFDIGGDGDDRCWAEADYIKIISIAPDGTESDYVPTGMTWSGHKYDEPDLLAITSSAYVNANPTYEFFEVCNALVQLKAENDRDVACSAAGRDIPRFFYEFWTNQLFKLAYVTDKSIYYTCYDSVRMLDMTGKVISDNYFAEEGLRDSIECVLRGDEVEIWCDPDLEEYKEDIEREM